MKLSQFSMLAMTSITLFCSGATHALNSPCDSKAQEIQTKIGYAKQFGNQHEITALELALQTVQLHCSDASEQKKQQRLIAEKQRKVTEMKHRIAEREEELSEAQGYGVDRGKIAKLRQKLERSKRDLEDAKVKLDEAKNALS